MFDYYSRNLAALRLKQAYDLAPTRIKQYLKSEIDFIISHIKPGDMVLELGCGYGRVLRGLGPQTEFLLGIDTSLDSIYSAKSYLADYPHKMLACMDAAALGFNPGIFDLVVCIQNGISAFHISPEILFSESIRITKPGGYVFISSYAPDIWDARLEWFRLQSEAGLIGDIDWEKTGNGKIVSKDGFSGTTYGREDFDKIVKPFKIPYEIITVDNSSVFCAIRIPENR